MDSLGGGSSEKRQRFKKAVEIGTWTQFLEQDAKIARKAFKVWFSEVYLKTPEGRGLPKNVKQQIHHISDAVVHRTRRSQLLPGTIDVLAIWEDIPLVPGTSEWGVARVRLIAHLLVHGLFRESQAQGLVVTEQEIAEARLWLYKKPDGTVSRFEPIRQPWHFRDLHWVPKPNTGGSFEHIVEVHTSEQGMEIAVAEHDQNNPEALRISPQTLQQLVRAPIQPDEPPIAKTSQARNIAVPRRLRDTVGQSRNEAHPAQNSSEQNFGASDGRANRTRTRTDQSSDTEQSEEPMITSTRRIGVAGPMIKPEAEGADDAAPGATSMTTRPAFSPGSTTNLSRSSTAPFGRVQSGESGTRAHIPIQTSEQAQQLGSCSHSTQQMNDETEALLEVSEDEEDHFDKRVKMDDIPSDWDSNYHSRFQQDVEAQSEGHSSDLQVIEQTTDDNNGDVQEVGQGRLVVPSLPSSPFGGVGVQDKGDQKMDTELKTEEEAIAFFANQGDPNPERSAAQLFGTDRWISSERDVDETPKSEATTDILSRDDTEMVGSGDGLYDEQDKENRLVSGFENGPSDEDDRLEVRMVQDMYATSEDELSAVTM
ncbi:MAG: hypothetical protein Q9180_003847 [Flavoplaca navasiana]